MSDPSCYRLPGTRFSEAKWIWPFEEVKANAHVLFRSSFHVDSAGESAWMFVAVESCARIFLNGKEVLRTSSLSYPGQHYCESVDLSDALREGVNELAILAWYIGVPSGASCPKDPGLLAEIVNEDGIILASSGTDWRACPLDAWLGQQRRSKWLNLDLIEILDFGKLPPDFPMVGNSGGFSVPETRGYPGSRFVLVEPRQFLKPTGDCLREFSIVEQGIVNDQAALHSVPSMAVLAEEIEDTPLGIGDMGQFSLKAAPEGKAWSVIIDLGTYEKGLPRMIATGDSGTQIDITWYESLDTPESRTILSSVHTTDRYILSGREDLIVPEEWKCGRFLQLTFRSIKNELTVKEFFWERMHYPLEQRVAISSSSRKLERIIEISRRAAALCMHDNIMDCPWRERRQWIGDVQRIALVNYYSFGEFALPRAVLKQHVRLQDISGRMWVCLPIFEEFPSQSMEWLRAILEYQKYSGDETLLLELSDNIEMLHRWFLKCRDDKGLFFLDTRPAINWMDNSFGSILTLEESVMSHQFETPFLVLNLRYLLFLDDVVTVMLQLGRQESANQVAIERERLASIIHEYFWEPDIGLFRDSANKDVPMTVSEIGHALAVCCDLPDIELPELWDRFEAYAANNQEVILSLPFGKYHTLEALGKLGRPDAIVKDIMKNWGPMVDGNADTTWERFDNTSSRCHGWSGIPVVALMRHVLHHEPNQAGESTARGIAGIDWIRACVD